ncbi:hypothetical protein BHF71_02290 [Vulcanibacillus modesticaldus]|uniref:Nuclease SbcCD subunit C n=1 Tax=Vulcanibacillus modesticaldus TaxID=337097 RepID=A0A1D2YTL0_9BACI|nr:AAA family ATPase [Vulcanibacillus modesticaldus]OEF99038.1 hypothetical protein BHF71_02290 [Vulcanibacillus modesticaldus]
MRPISLSIAGLHSFRQKQTIDFTLVDNAGVFGIFGPTGSGKSTILDAITLALYGRVERSDASRIGILNQQEDKIQVKFVFELNSGHNTQRYHVERVYSKNKEQRVRSTLARLIKLEDNKEIVLADKEKDVTKEVEAILGLTVDDFTRAVVLPQGKFAEFLTLKPSERRPMLERLFQLDQYGKRLKDKALAKENELKRKRDEVEAKQSVLADATRENLDNLKKSLNEATDKKEEIERELVQFLEEYNNKARIWEIQQKLLDVEEQLQELLNQEENIIQLTEKQSNAEKAMFIEPTLNQYKSIKQQRETTKNSVIELSSTVENLQQEVSKKKREYEDLKKHYEEQIPILTEKKVKLQEAVEWEEEIKTLENTISSSINAKNSLVEKMKEIELEYNDFQQKIVENNEDIVKTKDRLEEIYVSTEERRNLDQAWEIRQELLNVLKEKEKKLTELDKLKEKIRETQDSSDDLFKNVKESEKKCLILENELNDLQKKQPISDEKWYEREKLLIQLEISISNLTKQQVSLNKLYEDNDQTIAAITEFKNKLEEHKKKEKSIESLIEKKKNRLLELEDIKRKYLVSQLATQLEEGKPCLVCGSTHHPSPSKLEINQDVDGEIELLNKEISTEGTTLETVRIELKLIESDLDKLNDQLAKLADEISNNEADIKEQLATLPEDYQELDLEQFSQKIEQDKEQHLQLKEELENWNNQNQKLQEQLKTMKDELTKRNQKYQISLNEIKLLQERREEIEQSLSATKKLEEQVNQKWFSTRGDWELDTIEVRRKEIFEFDQERENLQKHLNELENNNKAFEEKAKKLVDQLQETKRQMLQIEADIKRDSDYLTELNDKCNRLTAGTPAKELIERIKTEEKVLSKELNQSEHDFKGKNDQLIQLEKKLSSEQAILDNLNTQFEKSLEQLKNFIELEQWQGIEQIEEYLLSSEELNLINEQITDFYDRKKLLSETRRQYLEQINNGKLTEEEWKELQKKKNELENELENRKQKLSELTFQYKQLEKEYKEWKQMDEKRQSIQKELDIASELNQVLRGNAFVDFIAQEYLHNITIIASEKLKSLTRNRYSLRVDMDGGFSLIDELNGGLSRPVQTLSGGETFLTSLSLALALSSQIQLKGGQQLEFFFLDEGFGSLDSDLLDTVMMTLEKLHADHMLIGIISHVPELQIRINRRFIVIPPDSKGNGSRVKFEYA